MCLDKLAEFQIEWFLTFSFGNLFALEEFEFHSTEHFVGILLKVVSFC